MNWPDLILGIEIGALAGGMFVFFLRVKPLEVLLQKSMLLNEEMLKTWQEFQIKLKTAVEESSDVQPDGSVRSPLQPFV